MVGDHSYCRHVPAQQRDVADQGTRKDGPLSPANLEHGSDVGQYRKLTARVRSALKPVKPSASFRQTLARELSEVVQHRHYSNLSVASPPSHRELIMGAAIASAVALAGSIIYVLRSHVQARSQKADGART